MNRPIGRFKRCYRLRPAGVNPALFRLLQRGSKFKVAHYRADHYRRSTHLCKCDRRCLRFGSGFRTASQGLSFSDGKRDSLFSRKVYRLLNERRERKPRPKARFDFVCGASELDGSHYDAALHSPLEWLLAQTRESRGGYGTQLFRLQLPQNSSYTSRVASYGRRRHGSALERRGPCSPLGSLRTAEGGKSGVNDGPNNNRHLSSRP